MAQITYKDAGVDLELYDQAMAKLPKLMQKTHTPRVMPLTGGFAGLFRLDSDSSLFSKNYEEPVLVSGTDGVGTKLKIAVAAGTFDTIGIDLVGMCVNDCLCVGAEPLFFLDYLALGKDDPVLIAQLVDGISRACVDTGMALLGGETAIMPDVYQPGDFDLAGFSVGVVERRQIIDGTQMIQAGDVLIGIESSGFHSNGYSLLRKVVTEAAGLNYDSYVPELQKTVAEALLEPTRLYVRSVLDVLGDDALRPGIHGLAHITGGGLPDNISRILPAGCGATVRTGSWQPAPVFDWVLGLGEVATEEMFHVFNMGIGFVLAVSPDCADAVVRKIGEHEFGVWPIGEVVEGGSGVQLEA